MHMETSWLGLAQTRILEQVATGAALPDVLAAIVRLIEEQAEGMTCSILLLDPTGNCLRDGAGPNLPLSYRQLLDGQHRPGGRIVRRRSFPRRAGCRGCQ